MNQVKKMHFQQLLKEHPEWTKKQINNFRKMYMNIRKNLSKINLKKFKYDKDKEFRKYIKYLKHMIKKENLPISIINIDYKKGTIEIEQHVFVDGVSFDITFPFKEVQDENKH